MKLSEEKVDGLNVDKKKGILNICISIVSKVVLLVLSIIVRRLLIQNIGNEVNGLNSLYANMIGMLTVAELGVGSAINFSMYKPIVANEKRKVAALYYLYRKLYRVIGIVIFIIGLMIMPFLPIIIEDYESLNVDVSSTFFLTLLSVDISFFYSAKTSLIEAYKNNYITTIIGTIARLIRFFLQIAAILLWKSFTVFLVCQILETGIIWALTEVIIRRNYVDIIKVHESIDSETKTEIKRNIRAMMMHKIGNVIVNTIDSLIISAVLGVVILGKYSNYSLIVSALASIISLVFSPLISVVGHLCATEDRKEIKRWFDHFYCLNYVLGVVFFLGYFAIIDNLIYFCFGSGLRLSRPISFIISVNQFMHYMRRSLHLFRDASGTFYNDRWKPIAEGVLNLILSILLVSILPDEFKVVGVILATIITTLVICNTVEPYIVFHYVFGQSPKHFYKRNYIYTVVFICCLLLVNKLVRPCDNQLMGLFINGFISVGVSVFVLCVLSVADKDFRYEVESLVKKILTYV